jgi:hypothetical protein
MPSVAFAPRPEDFDEDFFGIPVLTWNAPPEPETEVKPPSPARPTAAPVAAR